MDAFDNLISLNVMGIDVIRERKRKETWVFGTIKKKGGGVGL